jgi:steroid delta-isomerase-like uncharacterized protein
VTRQEIAEIVEAFRQAKDGHDVEAIVDLRSEDCVDYLAATGLRIEGKDAIRRYFRSFFSSVPDYRGEFDGIAYGQDSAVAWGHFAGTINGELFGIPVEGLRQLRVPCAFVMTFRDGKVVEDRQYWDAATVAEQLGVPLAAIRGTPVST